MSQGFSANSKHENYAHYFLRPPEGASFSYCSSISSEVAQQLEMLETTLVQHDKVMEAHNKEIVEEENEDEINDDRDRAQFQRDLDAMLEQEPG